MFRAIGCLGLVMVGCAGDVEDGPKGEAFVAGTVRFASNVPLPQQCALRLMVPPFSEAEPILLEDLPEALVNAQHPIGEYDQEEGEFWLTEDDISMFSDDLEYGWHAWIACSENGAVDDGACWGLHGDGQTEAFTPPRADLSIDVEC